MNGNTTVALVMFLLVLIPISFVAGVAITAIMTEFYWLPFLLFLVSLYATYRVTSVSISKD